MAKRLLLPRSQVVGSDGRPIAGAKLYTYATGTSTAKAVYSDAALTVAHANPVVADSAGRFPAMFLAAGDYRTVLADASDVTIATDDPVEGDASGDEAGAAALAARRNRIINPTMQHSQEFGATNTDVTTGPVFVIDQWTAALSTAPGGTLRVAQVESTTPAGAPNRLRCTVQAADASLAAGDVYMVEQYIEGNQIADARLGSSSARQIFVRFGVRCSIAGTFGLSLSNSGLTRAYVALFTVAAGEVNTDLVRTFTIPGDEAGTWLVDEGIGLRFSVCLAAGSDFHGNADEWQAGNIKTTSGQTNFMGTLSATFELFDVGLYVDSTGSGVAPPYEMPSFDDELRSCQRYYVGARYISCVTQASTTNVAVCHFPVEMRTTPAVAGTVLSSANVDTAVFNDITTGTARFSLTATAGGVGEWTGNYVANARY